MEDDSDDDDDEDNDEEEEHEIENGCALRFLELIRFEEDEEDRDRYEEDDESFGEAAGILDTHPAEISSFKSTNRSSACRVSDASSKSTTTSFEFSPLNSQRSLPCGPSPGEISLWSCSHANKL